MGPEQKTRMSAAWDRWQSAANTQARANGTNINRASNPIEADALWGDLGMKQSASKACSCGCGDTVTTCKCGPSCKCRKPGGSCYKPADEKSAALGLWDRIRMKKERGGKPAKPGDKDYPDTKSWKKVTAISEKKAARGDTLKLMMQKMLAAANVKPFVTSWDDKTLLKTVPLADVAKPHATPMQALRGVQIWAGQQGQKVPARGSIGAKHVADVLRTTKNLPVMGLKPPSLNEYTTKGPQVFDNYTQLFDKLRNVPVTDVKTAGSPAWQRSAGKNEEGGLNAKGRASYNKATGGHLKAPVTEKHPTGKAKARRHSFCSRMCGMKRVNTGASTAKDPDSRINKSLRKWNCKCSSAAQFGVKLAYLLGNQR
jgi:hypothetical protein